MEIIRVDENLIDETSAFAQDTFINYYNDLIGNAQAVYMADLFLSKDAIRELIDKGAIFKIVKEDDKIIGFFEYQKEDNRVFLSKLYAAESKRGMGLGRIMFEDVVNYAKENNLDSIYLTVNKGNTPSYNIYLHLGFKVIDAVVNDIGNGYVMDDYIMEYKVNGS